MSIGERNGPGDSPGQAGTGSVHGSSTAVEHSARVASDVADSAKGVASEAAHQAGDVIVQAKQEVASLVDQARRELQVQLEVKGAEAAGGLRTLSSQLQALASGHPDEAGPLAGRVRDAQQVVHHLADRLEHGGSQGVVQDVTGFARRRPGTFLLGAVVAGFAVGRLLRAGTQASSGTPSATRPASELSSSTSSPMASSPPAGGVRAGQTSTERVAGAAPR
jgi:hypothetical protein